MSEETTTRDIERLEKRVKALENERNSFLRWGILALGAAVVGLGAYIWHDMLGQLRK